MHVGGKIQVQHETKFQITKQSVAPDSTISINWETKREEKNSAAYVIKARETGFIVGVGNVFYSR